MQITDFHIHSKYSRACSKYLDIEHINHWCQIKGIDIVATSDFTHPAWFKELSDKLEPIGNGFYKLSQPELARSVYESSAVKLSTQREVQFFLCTELSCIYSQGGKVRRIHILVAFPSIEDVAKFNGELENRGAKLRADGRPILGMSGKDIVKIALDVNEKAILIPAHVWTPWFAIFGSKSGFDSVEECFEEYSQYIYALETGLSSDPKMNWQLSKNDRYTLVSNSDAHSLENLGREANVLDLPQVSYDQLYDTIKTGDNNRFKYTIEFYPEEGKYHLDGHASCKFSCMPEETKRLDGRCPTCGKQITVGVHHRVNSIADQPFGREPQADRKIPYKSIVPLAEIIAETLGVKSTKGKRVMDIYKDIIWQVGNEFHTLLDADIDLIAKSSTPLIAEGIKRVREGNVEVKGGYDGIYGEIHLFSDDERQQSKQKSLL